MKKLLMVVVVFALGAGMLFAGQELITSGSDGMTTDLSGSGTTDAAWIYARFQARGIFFEVTSDDVWNVTLIEAGDDIYQNTTDGAGPIVVENTGGVAINLSAYVPNDDVADADARTDWVLWDFSDAAGCDAAADQYQLCLAFTDASVTDPAALGDIFVEVNDLDGATATTWAAEDRYYPQTSTAYPYYDSESELELWAGKPTADPDADNVNIFFAFHMSDAGASNVDPHAARVELTAKLAAD